MPNEVKNIREIVIWRETQNYQLPSNNRLTNLLKTYNGLNEQRLSKTNRIVNLQKIVTIGIYNIWCVKCNAHVVKNIFVI